MGVYLNGRSAWDMYQMEMKKPYFVDKSMIIKDILSLTNPYICITRPRRFGKSIMAYLIASFFGKNIDSSFFNGLQISQDASSMKHLNRSNVIFLSMDKTPKKITTYDAYIDRIENRLMKDLIKQYPDCDIDMDDALWDALSDIYENKGEKFIFVVDEWDYIFHQKFLTEENKENYIDFLAALLKGQPYIERVYMTGVLPIAKYSSGSKLNCFWEYTMATMKMFSGYFGFTETEVDVLYQRYCNICPEPKITRDELTDWYNGYFTMSGERLYNPRSVVAALENNQVADYWTSSGPYDEIYYYVKNNITDVRDDIAKMIAEESIKAEVQEYSAVSHEIKTKDQIFSAMVVYGFLTVKKGFLSIPNKELMGKFEHMVNNKDSLGYIYSLAKESERMLRATKAGDTDTMTAILEQVHNTETGMTGYNNEAELSAIIKLMYLSARDNYKIQREEKSGVGYVDYVLYPKTNFSDDCIIIELKIDATAKEAIEQIKTRHYTQEILGRLGETPLYTGRILAVGISYLKSDKSKRHDIKVEILRESI